jgi:hypothetical protein
MDLLHSQKNASFLLTRPSPIVTITPKQREPGRFCTSFANPSGTIQTLIARESALRTYFPLQDGETLLSNGFGLAILTVGQNVNGDPSVPLEGSFSFCEHVNELKPQRSID